MIYHFSNATAIERVFEARQNEDRLRARANALAHAGQYEDAAKCFKKALVFKRFADYCKRFC